MNLWKWLGWWILLLACARAEVVLHLGTCGRPGGWAEHWGQRLLAQLRGSSIRLRLSVPRSDLEQLRALDAGELQLAWVRSSALANWYRPWGLLSLPYALDDPAAWLGGLSGQRLLQPIPGERLRPLLVSPLGPRLLASRRHLQQWSDLKDQVVLVPQSRFSWEQYDFVGADPWPGPMERSDEFRARGGIDAVEACRLDLEEQGWSQELPELWDPGHSQEWLVLVAEERSWGRLNPQQHALLLKSARLSQQTSSPGRNHSDPTRARFRSDFGSLRRRLLQLLDESWRVTLP